MSHRGVLFLDELPEFGHRILEAMRQPLEDKRVVISRAQGSVAYPANFMLVGAMNPCPCGYYGDPMKQCTCTDSQVSRYGKRLSGPLIDRIDIFVDVPSVDYEKLTAPPDADRSENVRARTERARDVQRARFAGSPLLTNSEMGPNEVHRFCQLDEQASAMMGSAMRQMHLSARVYHRILKLSRTIADLSNSDNIQVEHLAEALQYRPPQWM